MPDHYIASFTGGEVSPALYGRIDSESYAASALQLENFIVRPSGGARRRTGTTYIAESVANSRLIGWRAFGKAIIVELQPSMIRLWDAVAETQIAVQNYDYSESADTQTDITTAGLVDFEEDHDGDDITAGDLSEVAVSFADVWKIQHVSITRNEISALVLTQEYENPLIIFAYNDGSTIHYGLNYTPCPTMESGVYHDGTQPRCVGKYKNRLIFANFENMPSRMLTTGATSDATTIDVSGALEKGPVGDTRDQYAVIPVFTLNAADVADTDSLSDNTIVNEIRWVQGREDLYLGSDEAVIRQHSRADNFGAKEAMVPQRSSEYASSFIQAFVVNESIMFLDAPNTDIRAIQFSEENQQFYAPSISMSAEHLLSSGVKQSAYARSPNPVAYLLTENGEIAVLNYDVAAGFANWSHLTTDGQYKSVASAEDDDGSLVFFITKRTTSSAGEESDVYIIEKQQPFTETKDDMHYVDSGKIVTGSPVTEVTGLTWLQGKEVSILADGAVLAPQTVPDEGDDAGTITIPDGFEPETVHVGLKYESMVVPMPIPMVFGNKKNIERLYLVLHETIGGEYGIYFEDGTTELYLLLMDSDLDSSPDFFSGVLMVNYPGTWEPFRSIYVGQSQPLPMELLSIRVTFVPGVK